VDDPTGAVVQLGFGQEWWLHPHALAGVLFSLTYADQSVRESNRESGVRTLVPQILFTATLN
jgi:hypothetical protein